MIYKEIRLNNYYLIYFKFNEVDEQNANGFESMKPYLSFNLGVKIGDKSWVGLDQHFQGEDGFFMFGTEYSDFLNKLKSLIYNYKEDELVISDYLQDTDAEIHIKCEKSRVLIFGHLGQECFWRDDSDYNMDSPVLKFKTETTSDCLPQLYNIFNEMTTN